MTSSLIFPELATNFSQTLSELKRSTLSVHNRLASVLDDSDFVCAVAEAYKLPLVANERCGSWYIPPSRKTGSAYFKSTDGHTGQWAFSNRRLNLQILDIIASKRGCVIVDSTRRGKSMPDALSKTIPIWCAVINRVLFPDLVEAQEYHAPPTAVSLSEKAQIEHRIPGFVHQLESLSIDMSVYKSKLKQPLRPIWVTRSSVLPEEPPRVPGFYPIVLCTASRQVSGAELSEGGYIQGAGDDSEGWSHGLTPSLFWKSKDELLQTPESELPELIARLLKLDQDATEEKAFSRVEACPQLRIGRTADLPAQPLAASDAIIWCDVDLKSFPRDHLHLKAGESAPGAVSKLSHVLHMKTRTGKLGSRDLRNELPNLIPFFLSLPEINNLYVCCTDGKDVSVGVALAIMYIFCTSNGTLGLPSCAPDLSTTDLKQRVRQNLAKIMTSIPSASPSGATLQSINSYLFSDAIRLVSYQKPNLPL